MKKIVTFLLFSFIILQTLHAQQEFRFGFQASPTFSWLATNSNKVNSDGVALGLKLSVLGEYYFHERYAFVGGIGFAFNQGGKLAQDRLGKHWLQSEHALKDEILQQGAVLKYSVQYIEIPFALKMTTRYFGSIRYYAEIPHFTLGFRAQSRGNLSGSVLDSVMVSMDVDEPKIDIKKEVAALNFAWGLGLGAEYEISESTSLVAGIFYQQGIIDTTDDKSSMVDKSDTGAGAGLVDEDSKATLRALTLRIGVMF